MKIDNEKDAFELCMPSYLEVLIRCNCAARGMCYNQYSVKNPHSSHDIAKGKMWHIPTWT